MFKPLILLAETWQIANYFLKKHTFSMFKPLILLAETRQIANYFQKSTHFPCLNHSSYWLKHGKLLTTF